MKNQTKNIEDRGGMEKVKGNCFTSGKKSFRGYYKQ